MFAIIILSSILCATSALYVSDDVNADVNVAYYDDAVYYDEDIYYDEHPDATTWESRQNDVAEQVLALYPDVAELIEMSLYTGEGAEEGSSTIDGLTRAHAVYVPSSASAPSVEVFFNLTGDVTMVYHEEPILGDKHIADGTLPAIPSFSSAFDMVVGALGDEELKIYNVVYRHPLAPCATEDMYIFETNVDPANFTNATSSFVSLGVSSCNICFGLVTEGSDIEMCKETPPVCIATANGC